RWAAFRVPGSLPVVKAIGSWIMGVAATGALGRESPGKSERRHRPPAPVLRAGAPSRDVISARPDTDEAFHASGTYYAGILFLIDAATGRYFQIRTDQGDSEILLVHDNSVYYRVNNRLLVATLQGASLGPPQLLV